MLSYYSKHIGVSSSFWTSEMVDGCFSFLCRLLPLFEMSSPAAFLHCMVQKNNSLLSREAKFLNIFWSTI